MIEKLNSTSSKSHQSNTKTWLFIVLIFINVIFFIFYFTYVTKCTLLDKSMEIKEVIEVEEVLTIEEVSEFKSEIPQGCICHGENFCFKGLDEKGKVVYGRPFNCRLYERLNLMRLTDDDANNAINDFDFLDESWNPIVMTVVSSNHFIESKGMVESVFKYHPNAKVIYYDSGLDPKQISEIKTFSNVQYRLFNFTNYPVHVHDMFTYAFKLAQLEVFQDHKTFYYFDASIRVKAPLNHLAGVKNKDLLPVTMPSQDMHSVYAALNLDMLEYLPIPRVLLGAQENAATFMFFSDSKLTRQVFKWWLLCGMTQDCIAPLGSKLSCGAVPRLKETYKVQLGCHRFDQAYFNIAILSYLFGEDKLAVNYKFVPNWADYTDSLIEEWNKNYRIRFELYKNSIKYECLKHKSKYYLDR